MSAVGCTAPTALSDVSSFSILSGNILLEENKKLDQIKVIDFGMATHFGDEKLTETMGTVAYMVSG